MILAETLLTIFPLKFSESPVFIGCLAMIFVGQSCWICVFSIRNFLDLIRCFSLRNLFSLRSFALFMCFSCVIKIQIGLILLVNSPVSWFLLVLIEFLLLGDDSFAAIYLLCFFYMHSANLMYDFVSFSSFVVALLLLLLFLFLTHSMSILSIYLFLTRDLIFDNSEQKDSVHRKTRIEPNAAKLIKT